MAGYARHPAAMDANRRQDPPDADALAESQLARAALRQLQGTHHVAHSARISLLRAISADSPIISIAIRFEKSCDPLRAAIPYRTCCKQGGAGPMVSSRPLCRRKPALHIP